MADKLTFSLVSPEAELFSGEVDQVDIPGSEGDLGVFPNHSPLMAVFGLGRLRFMPMALKRSISSKADLRM